MLAIVIKKRFVKLHFIFQKVDISIITNLKYSYIDGSILKKENIKFVSTFILFTYLLLHLVI